jgi:putative Flp pilus-assembly TadE/G-like protein
VHRLTRVRDRLAPRRPGGVLDRLAGRRPGRPRDDRGAVAVMVAILLAGGVLLCFLALVIDVGDVYLEHQQLQNGADAAALAVANACAKNAAECATEADAITLAQTLADGNANDRISNVASVCGDVPSGALDACGPPIGNRADCLDAAPAGVPYVEVHLSTETLDNKLLLPPIFAQTLSGNGGYQGASVGACARASWESSVDVLLMTISTCEFFFHTGAGFGSLDDPSTEEVINFWLNAFDDQNCPMQPPPPLPPGDPSRPQPGQGQAGILNGAGCSGSIPADGKITGYFPVPVALDTLPQNCENVLRAAYESQGSTTIYIPVYKADDVHPDGSVQFTIDGLAPFIVTGFDFGPPPEIDPKLSAEHNVTSFVSHQLPCDHKYARCISGFFTGPEIPLTSIIPSNNTIVRLVG